MAGYCSVQAQQFTLRTKYTYKYIYKKDRGQRSNGKTEKHAYQKEKKKRNNVIFKEIEAVAFDVKNNRERNKKKLT